MFRSSTRRRLRGSFLVRTGLLAAGLLAAAGCAGTGNTAGGTRGTGPETILVTRGELTKAGLSLRWQRQVGLTQGESIVEAWRVGDSIYVSTSEHQLHCLSASAGTTTWQADMGRASIRVYRPQESRNGQYTYVLTRGKVYVIDKRLGDIVTSANLGFSATCDPLVTEQSLCVGGADRFYGLYFDPLAGRHWTTVAPGDYFVARPASNGGALFIASLSGKIWSVNSKTGEPFWKDRKTNGECRAPLTADGARVYIPCMDRRLYCFDSNVGTPLWDTRLDGELNQPAMVAGRLVLCVGSGKGLYAMATENGELKWTLPGVTQLLSHTADHVYAADAAGTLLSIATDTGAVDSRLPIGNVQQFIRNEVDGLVFVVTRDGRVGAMEQAK